MRKSSRMMSGLYDQENCTFPSQMTLQFQAIRSAYRFQRKYWIGAIICGFLIIAGIASAFFIIGKEESMKSTESTKNYSKKIHIFNRIEDKVKLGGRNNAFYTNAFLQIRNNEFQVKWKF